jgi:NADPH-dependent 2,4-dienoyl-CoA reductase/sulfur reductase-like enzyme
MKRKKFDIIVIGGGSAGLASAIEADKMGLKVAILERDCRLGGILNQCIHNGFGLNYFKQELTGPEYAQKFVDKLSNTNIKIFLGTTVLEIEKKEADFRENINYKIRTISRNGEIYFEAKSVIFATGCREKPSGSISLCGSRPAGIISAGSAQRLINIYGKMVGKKIVVVGSGDIGLIMARRLRFEGAEVLGVYEIMPYPSGLKRNIVQCLEDYEIPLHLSKTVCEVVGKDRVEGVWVAPVKNDFSLDEEKKEFVPCDTVVLSIGLVPENDLATSVGIKLNNITNGAMVDEYLQTNLAGIFSCGNGLHVHDIVDNVSREAERAGQNSAKFVLRQLKCDNPHSILPKNGVRYTNPSIFYEGDGVLNINFRSNNIYRDKKIVVKCGDKIIREIEKKIILPAEMETIVVAKNNLMCNLEVSIE